MIRLSPYNLVKPDQPVFSLEARRIPWGRSVKLFTHKTTVWLMSVVTLVFSLWFVFILLPSLIQRPYVSHLNFLTQSTTVFISMGIVALGLISLLLDIASIRTALSSINADMESGRLDMIRLTTMREGQLILAKHGAAQMRAWRTTILLVGGRLGLLIILCIWFPLYVMVDLRIDVTSVMYSLPTMPLVEAIRASDPLLFLIGFSITLLAVFAFGATFVLEPIWRMRGMTAAGLAVSARVNDRSLAAISGIAVLFMVWFAQIAIFFGGLIVAFFLGPFGIFLLPFVFFACIFFSYMAFFAFVKTLSLRIVARRMIALAA